MEWNLASTSTERWSGPTKINGHILESGTDQELVSTLCMIMRRNRKEGTTNWQDNIWEKKTDATLDMWKGDKKRNYIYRHKFD